MDLEPESSTSQLPTNNSSYADLSQSVSPAEHAAMTIPNLRAEQRATHAQTGDNYHFGVVDRVANR